MKFYSLFAVSFVMALLCACGDTSESITETNGEMESYSKPSKLPECDSENDGKIVWVESEQGLRKCYSGKWYSLRPVTDTTAIEKDAVSCHSETLADSSGKKIICDGDSVGVVLNGDDAEKILDSLLSAEAVLDSEKIAVLLESVSGHSQKGPFLKGSSIMIKELENGRTLLQTGNAYNGLILSDDGRFKIRGDMLVSQYVMIQVEGFYRNEVTGKKSDLPLTLFAISNVNSRSVVNINLLTHLEYERVQYLVTKEKKKVFEAKSLAEKEIFALFEIDATDFSSAEDLNIAGSSDEDGALLAISILLQGDRSVSELSELLTEISTSMETEGTWKNDSTLDSIAIWAAIAEISNGLDTIRKNVESWKLSSMVPDFESHIHHFWMTRLNMEECSSEIYGKMAKSTFICRENNKWDLATELEKLLASWSAGKNNEIRRDELSGKYFIYDGSQKRWRLASDPEILLGVCTAKKVGTTGKVKGYEYECKSNEWIRTSKFILDTLEWIPGSDGSIKSEGGLYYTYDEALNEWVSIEVQDVQLGLNGCTTNRLGTIGYSSNFKAFVVCEATDSGNAWELTSQGEELEIEAFGKCDASNEKETRNGIVQTSVKFVCDGNRWRQLDFYEREYDVICVKSLWGTVLAGGALYCSEDGVSLSSFYDISVEGGFLNPDVDYGELTDARDGKVYKTVKIGNQVWMAENLNYHDTEKTPNLESRSWCYGNRESNCDKGGRLYAWSAMMDLEGYWNEGYATDYDVVQNPHQGVCPDGWHIPTQDEFETLLENASGDLWSQNIPGHDDLKNSAGFSLIPTGWNYAEYTENEEYEWTFEGAGETAVFAVVDEEDEFFVYTIEFTLGELYRSYSEEKSSGFSVRCLKDK